MKNLILIEGISGVGKSTTTSKLCEKLRGSGYTANCYLEGDIESPVDSFWRAYLTKPEYEKIRIEYPDFAHQLSENCTAGDNYVLVRYQDRERRYYSPEVYEYLKGREFCYNPANPLPPVKYTEVFSDMWRRFAEIEQTKQDFVIADGSFLHHQINDLIRNYNASEDDIFNHLTKLLRTVQPLNPIVFYLSSQNVGERLTKARDSRSQTAPNEDMIAFWKKRKDLDLSILSRLPAESHILDISHEEWDSALDIMFSQLIEI